MKKIIHLEDNLQWQEVVRASLMLNTDIEPVITYGSIEDFRKANYPSADLYVCDRHLPDKPEQHPNDHSWRQLIDTINCLHPGMNLPLVILSSHPPRNWRSYGNVVAALQKPSNVEEFDFQEFRDKIEYYLGLNRGEK